jgi:hypothetical protein
MIARQVGMRDKSHVSRLHNQTRLHVCLITRKVPATIGSQNEFARSLWSTPRARMVNDVYVVHQPERNSARQLEVGTCDKGHVSCHHNQTCSCTCLRTRQVLTTCRVKWYDLNQVHQVLPALLLYVPYHWLGQMDTNKVSRVLLCFNFSLAEFLGGCSAFPFQSLCVITPGLVQWVILPEFPVCYSVSISLSLCIHAQGLLSNC